MRHGLSDRLRRSVMVQMRLSPPGRNSRKPLKNDLVTLISNYAPRMLFPRSASTVQLMTTLRTLRNIKKTLVTMTLHSNTTLKQA